MFARIMAVMLAVVVLLTSVLSVLGAVMLRNQQTAQRLEELKTAGREIAWLASLNRASTTALMLGFNDDTQRILSWKANQVYEQYSAYICVVDRRGRMMDNFSVTLSANPDFAATLTTASLGQILSDILSGEEISLRTQSSSGPLFTVGVPFVQGEQVLGAVLIQTPTQTIEGGEKTYLPRVLLVAAVALLLSGAAVLLLTRQVLKPLRQVAGVAHAMSDGDFTARVDAENAPREISEVASAFNNMAEKLADTERNRREFVANVSHELKSPITAISGLVQGMEDGTIPPEDQGKYLTVVGQETRRLSKLIGDLLSLSRLEREDAQLQLTDFDICEMLRRAIIRRMSDLEEKELTVDCDFAADPCYVEADADRLEEVVVNLMDNAIKFTPQGGKLTLSTREEGDRCFITVADNGTGILPEDRPHVFERFFTADRAHTSGKGTGLGLSICQRILEMHGQTIRLKDTEEGAAFEFTLKKGKKPARKAAAQEAENA